MDATRLRGGYLGVLMAFFLVLSMPEICHAKYRIIPGAASSYGNGLHSMANNVNETTGDQVSIFCRKQLKQINSAIQNFIIDLPQVKNHNKESDVAVLRTLVLKAITGQHTNFKQCLQHIFKSSKFLSGNPIKERSIEVNGRPSGRILKPRHRRRRRRRRRRKRRPRQRWSVPSPAPSTEYPDAPIPVFAPNGAPSPTDKVPSPARTPYGAPFPTMTPHKPISPTPTSYVDLSPTPNVDPDPDPDPEPDLEPEPLPEPSTKSSPNVESQAKTKVDPDSQTKDKNKQRKLLIIVVALIIVATLAIFFLFLVCFLRFKRRGCELNDGQRKRKLFSTGSFLRSKKARSGKDGMQNVSTKSASTSGYQVSKDGSLQFPPGRRVPPSSPPLPPPMPPPLPPPPPPQAIHAHPPPEAPPPPPKPANVPYPPKAKPPTPPGLHHRHSRDGNEHRDSNANKTKLKPFFWDKVNTSPNRSMVWHDIKAGSFQFNEEMMEKLFGYGSTIQKKNDNGKNPQNLQFQPKLIQIIEPKKSQNLAILLKALNVTAEEVSDALMQGIELPVEFISTLLKMAPTPDEELKLRSYNGDITLLGTSERFLKVLVDIPFAFKRLEALLFMGSLHEEYCTVKESFSTLEVACTTLRNSRLLKKLLEAVLKTGNRMNVGTYRGGAQAFKLDTLLKLSDVKGTDGKTTLLSFVVQEIIRSEGNKAARRTRADRSSSGDVLKEPSKEAIDSYRNQGLEVVSNLSEELVDVKKAALVDGDTLTSTVLKLGHMLRKTKDFLDNEMKTVDEDKDNEFRAFLTEFVGHAETDIKWLLEEEKRVMALVKDTGDYFHGKSRKDEGLHLFVVVRDFLILLDNVCNEIKRTTVVKAKNNPTEESSWQSGLCDKLFPANKDSQSGCPGSDEESDSP